MSGQSAARATMSFRCDAANRPPHSSAPRPSGDNATTRPRSCHPEPRDSVCDQAVPDCTAAIGCPRARAAMFRPNVWTDPLHNLVPSRPSRQRADNVPLRRFFPTVSISRPSVAVGQGLIYIRTMPAGVDKKTALAVDTCCRIAREMDAGRCAGNTPPQVSFAPRSPWWLALRSAYSPSRAQAQDPLASLRGASPLTFAPHCTHPSALPPAPIRAAHVRFPPVNASR